ncbi:hypothetical protein GYMLUDRAFT_61966 [Collybiopsis luxurians FD-317 M1]|uniref:Uncharacterized protein n=1 Tax=Collybiopsis luxurians FD-317 M1 TaxID=944289 RepID=A0A0D0BNK5_9AGAR|nr:hypothetical protein GYMLUDRAFT_61966 [Collybiopsis luxurians FD-317 M1]
MTPTCVKLHGVSVTYAVEDTTSYLNFSLSNGALESCQWSQILLFIHDENWMDLCQTCDDGKWRKWSHCLEHAKTRKHQTALRSALEPLESLQVLPGLDTPSSEPSFSNTGFTHGTTSSMLGPPVQTLHDLVELGNTQLEQGTQLQSQSHPSEAEQSAFQPHSPLAIHQDLFSNTELAPPPEETFVQHLSQDFSKLS